MRSRLRLLRLRRRLGRRGAFLSCFGAVWILYGYGLLVEPLVSTVSFQVLVDLWPVDVWAWLWISSGCAAVAGAWLPAPKDWFGFAALYPLATLWGVANFMSWQPYGDNPRGWVGAAVWGVMGGAITVAAGWSEPLPARRNDPHDGN